MNPNNINSILPELPRSVDPVDSIMALTLRACPNSQLALRSWLDMPTSCSTWTHVLERNYETRGGEIATCCHAAAETKQLPEQPGILIIRRVNRTVEKTQRGLATDGGSDDFRRDSPWLFRGTTALAHVCSILKRDFSATRSRNRSRHDPNRKRLLVTINETGYSEDVARTPRARPARSWLQLWRGGL